MIWKSSFLAGFITAGAIMCLIQDSMGQEGYIQHIAENWVTPWFSIPISIIGLIIAGWILWRNKLIEKMLVQNIKEFYATKMKKYSGPTIVKGSRGDRN